MKSWEEKETTTVRCEVNTCIHWLANAQCGATGIGIRSGDGGLPGSPTGTACRTFYRKRGLANYLGSLQSLNWWGVIGLESESAGPQVECRVSNCRFWTPGDLCQADQITVSGPGAATSADTNCATFTP